MRKPILWLLIAASTLTACASGGPPTLAPKLTVPEAFKSPAPALPQPKSGRTQDLLANHVEVARAYHQLRDQLRGLVAWLEATEAR